MAKPNKRHHELCQKYKQSGRREINKALRQERNQRRIEKFARRGAAKEAREWDGIPKDPETRGSNREAPIGDFAWRPKQDRMVPYQRETSFMRRIQNQLDAEVLQKKQAEQRKKSKKQEGKED